MPEGCEVHTLAVGSEDAVGALEALADLIGAPADGALLTPAGRPEIPTGDLDAAKVAAVVGALLPEGAIVVDEAQTAGIYTPGATAGCPHHDWLTLCGGAIGMGIPLATGAAVACPDRRVLNLEADGSAMYTLQGLWTQAREGLDVTTVIYNNGSYAILNMEMGRVGAGAAGPTRDQPAGHLPPGPELRLTGRGPRRPRRPGRQRRRPPHRAGQVLPRARPQAHRGDGAQRLLAVLSPGRSSKPSDRARS